MRTVFIIGGMGSGKSTVTRLFAEEGFPTLDLDRVGHEVLLIDWVRDSLVEAFGADILNEEGQINRRSLAAKAFVSPEQTKRISQITTSPIIAELEEWLSEQEQADQGCVIIEVSAFDGPEDSYARFATDILAVVAPVELRVKRAVVDGFAEDDVRHRIARQASDDDRRQWAQFVIENDSSFEHLRAQVKELAAKLKHLVEKHYD